MGFREKKQALDEVLEDNNFKHTGKKIIITPIEPQKPVKIEDSKEVIPPSPGEPGYEEWKKKIWG